MWTNGRILRRKFSRTSDVTFTCRNIIRCRYCVNKSSTISTNRLSAIGARHNSPFWTIWCRWWRPNRILTVCSFQRIMWVVANPIAITWTKRTCCALMQRPIKWTHCVPDWIISWLLVTFIDVMKSMPHISPCFIKSMRCERCIATNCLPKIRIWRYSRPVTVERLASMPPNSRATHWKRSNWSNMNSRQSLLDWRSICLAKTSSIGGSMHIFHSHCRRGSWKFTTVISGWKWWARALYGMKFSKRAACTIQSAGHSAWVSNDWPWFCTTSMIFDSFGAKIRVFCRSSTNLEPPPKCNLNQFQSLANATWTFRFGWQTANSPSIPFRWTIYMKWCVSVAAIWLNR